MIYELSETEKAAPLFAGWNDTMIRSCLEKVMGRVYVTDPAAPKAAFAYAGCFGFLAGAPEEALLEAVPAGFSILVPQDAAWEALIEKCLPEAAKITRYAIRKDTRFDRARLARYVSQLPEGYTLRRIDGELYGQCLLSPVFADFVSAFESREQYLRLGRGTVVLKDGAIVSGASSFTRYTGGIEIEVDTVREERRKHLALAACAALILSCLEEGLYPSWDAHNPGSVALAEKLGYEFSHAYTAYEIRRQSRVK